MATRTEDKDSLVKKDLQFMLRIKQGKEPTEKQINDSLAHLKADSGYERDGFYSIADVTTAVLKTLEKM